MFLTEIVSVGQGRFPSHQVRRKTRSGVVESSPLSDGFTHSEQPQLGNWDWFAVVVGSWPFGWVYVG